MHGRLHKISRETINSQIYKGNNKTSLFHIINLSRVSPSPQELRDLLTIEGSNIIITAKLMNNMGVDIYLFESTT
jgi:hypothetical protein